MNQKKKIIQYHGLGRRKSSIARVILRPGSGTITVNKRPVEQYLTNSLIWINRVLEPLQVTHTAKEYDVFVNVNGGGLKGQADAIRLGISRALLEINGEHRDILKAQGMLTRDPREVERKHYYRRKARKGPQYSKR